MPNMVGTPSSQRQIPSCSPTEGLYFLLPHDAIRHSYVDTQLSRNASLRAWKEIEIINGEHRKPSESQPLCHKVPRMSVLALLMLLLEGVGLNLTNLLRVRIGGSDRSE